MKSNDVQLPSEKSRYNVVHGRGRQDAISSIGRSLSRQRPRPHIGQARLTTFVTSGYDTERPVRFEDHRINAGQIFYSCTANRSTHLTVQAKPAIAKIPIAMIAEKRIAGDGKVMASAEDRSRFGVHGGCCARPGVDWWSHAWQR